MPKTKKTKVKEYIVRVNCIAFKDYLVEATNKMEACEIAESLFSCDGSEGEAITEDVEEYDKINDNDPRIPK